MIQNAPQQTDRADPRVPIAAAVPRFDGALDVIFVTPQTPPA